MAVTYTENYNLGKQENHADKFDMSVITENMDKIDKALSEKINAVEGKGLITDDERKKLSELKNYDDTEISSNINMNKSTLGYIKRNFYQHSRNNQTINGITFTVNDDKSFTMSGTATQLASFMTTNFQTIPQGKYLCNGCEGGSSSTYYLRLETAKSSDQTTSGNVLRQMDGEDVPIAVVGDYDSIKVNIVVQAGVTVDNVRIAPMIRSEHDIDPTYEPYKPSVADQLAEIFERLVTLEGTALISEEE